MRFLVVIGLLLVANWAIAQSVNVPLDARYQHLIDRFEVKSGKLSTDFHTPTKPFTRSSVIRLTERIEADSMVSLSDVDKWNLIYLQNDSWEELPPQRVEQSDSYRPLLKYLYRKKSDFFHHQSEDATIHVNPIFHFGYARDIVNGVGEGGKITNVRGIEIRGSLNNKLGFYSTFTENQVRVPAYVRAYARALNGFPQEGFTKVVGGDSTRFLADYLSARAYLAFRPIKNLELQFGHDRHFIGSGIRSMFLSDFSAPFLFLKGQVQLGRFQYTSIFGQLTNAQLARPANGSVPYPPKYMALHRLSVHVARNLNIGLVETVMFGKRQIGFDPNYLNPVILYRFVEGMLGSSDNSLVGVDARWNFLRTASLYGQFVLDEFNLSEKKASGWWAKKYGVQAGAKYIDAFGIANLDLQAEYNMARPFLYSHFSTYSNLVHYNMPLTHPLGANFQEGLLNIRVQPWPRLFLSTTALYARKGEDFAGGGNYGGNVLRLYTDSRVNDYGNKLTQGHLYSVKSLHTTISYMLRHNLFLDAQVINRQQEYQGGATSTEHFAGAAVRWNIGQNSLIF